MPQASSTPTASVAAPASTAIVPIKRNRTKDVWADGDLCWGSYDGLLYAGIVKLITRGGRQALELGVQWVHARQFLQNWDSPDKWNPVYHLQSWGVPGWDWSNLRPRSPTVEVDVLLGTPAAAAALVAITPLVCSVVILQIIAKFVRRLPSYQIALKHFNAHVPNMVAAPMYHAEDVWVHTQMLDTYQDYLVARWRAMIIILGRHALEDLFMFNELMLAQDFCMDELVSVRIHSAKHHS